MKNILRTTLAAFLLFTVGSCDMTNDKDPVVQANGFALRSVDVVSPVALLHANDNNIVATLDWDKSNNGPASVPTYTVVVSEHADATHTNEQVLNGGNTIEVTNDLRTYVLKVGELNAAVNKLTNAHCGQPIAVDIMAKSTLGIVTGNAFVQYSNPITVTVSPYTNDMPIMSFAMVGQDPAAAPKIAASSLTTTDYEGYMYLQVGDYFFNKPDACNGFSSPTVYGDDGTFSTLTVAGAVPVHIYTAGNFRVIADTNSGTYSVIPINIWGTLGNATIGFPGSATNPYLVYDAANNVYRTTLTLHGLKNFKFRANNQYVLAKFDPTKTGVLYAGPQMSYNGLDILVPGITDQVYDITLDLSSPRNYKYTLTLH